MTAVSASQLRDLLTPARARAAAAFDHDLDAGGDLRSHCVAVSLYLRDVLRAAGHAGAWVRAGYFSIDDPDPEVCACGSYRGSHDEACYYEPHAWVELGDWLIDATASQFNELCEASCDELVITPRREALRRGPWVATVSWDDGSWQGIVDELRGEWPASLERIA